MNQAKRKLNKMHWIKQLVPRTLYSLYRTEAGREFCIWRQWFGRSYEVRRFPVRGGQTQELALLRKAEEAAREVCIAPDPRYQDGEERGEAIARLRIALEKLACFRREELYVGDWEVNGAD